MPRFFFNYREGASYTVDDTGVEFDTFEAAYVDAFNAAREMWPEMMAQRVDPRSASFEIFDQPGHHLATLPFSEVLENCASRPIRQQDIRASIASVMDAAHLARRTLSEFRHELRRSHSQLIAAKQLVGMIDDIEMAGRR
jgi:uncharacterized protein DUF6894